MGWYVWITLWITIPWVQYSFLNYNAWPHVALLIVVFHSLFKLFSLFIRLKACGLQERQVLKANLALSSCFSSIIVYISYNSGSLVSLTISSFNNKKAKQKQCYQPCALKARHLPTSILAWPLSSIIPWPHSQVLLVIPYATRKIRWMKTWQKMILL